MNGNFTLYVSQYGDKIYASTVKELRKKVGNGGSRISKMYVNKRNGKTVHCGYVIGGLWLTAYRPYEK